jgi:hypothetical protein
VIKPLTTAQSILNTLWLLFGLSIGSCGVNSGNPIGNTTTTASIYLQTSAMTSIKSLTIRVRGLQLVSTDNMNKPDNASSENIIFDSVKEIDLADRSSGDLVTLVENQKIAYRDYRQVRLLLDPSKAGTAVMPSGETKTVLALPLDLFVEDQGSAAPSGGRQTDQLAMVSGESMMRASTSNKLSVGLNWPEVMVGPQTLSSRASSYFLQEKGLSQDQLDQAMFIQPMQANKPSIRQISKLGLRAERAP